MHRFRNMSGDGGRCQSVEETGGGVTIADTGSGKVVERADPAYPLGFPPPLRGPMK